MQAGQRKAITTTVKIMAVNIHWAQTTCQVLCKTLSRVALRTLMG
jgi:hypothetical protein